MRTSSWRTVLALGVSVAFAGFAAMPEARANVGAATVGTADLIGPPAAGAHGPDATPTVRLARVAHSRSDVSAEAPDADLPVPGALALFGTGLIGLVVIRLRRPSRRV